MVWIRCSFFILVLLPNTCERMMVPQPSLSDIPEDVQRKIQLQLDAIEQERSVRILLAVESGSRAWGYATESSDYDVRFIYVRPQLDYLAVDEPQTRLSFRTRDMIQPAGWDLRETLRIGLEGDPAVTERLTSPIVYREQGWEAAALRKLFVRVDGADELLEHYFGLAYARCRSDFKDRQSFKLKRYFRAIRPVLALLWLLQRPGETPPLSLPALMDGVVLPVDVLHALQGLLERRPLPRVIRARERIPVLEEFCMAQFEWAGEALKRMARRPDIDMYDEAERLFLKSVLGS